MLSTQVTITHARPLPLPDDSRHASDRPQPAPAAPPDHCVVADVASCSWLRAARQAVPAAAPVPPARRTWGGFLAAAWRALCVWLCGSAEYHRDADTAGHTLRVCLRVTVGLLGRRPDLNDYRPWGAALAPGELVPAACVVLRRDWLGRPVEYVLIYYVVRYW